MTLFRQTTERLKHHLIDEKRGMLEKYPFDATEEVGTALNLVINKSLSSPYRYDYPVMIVIRNPDHPRHEYKISRKILDSYSVKYPIFSQYIEVYHFENQSELAGFFKKYTILGEEGAEWFKRHLDKRL